MVTVDRIIITSVGYKPGLKRELERSVSGTPFKKITKLPATKQNPIGLMYKLQIPREKEGRRGIITMLVETGEHSEHF